MKFETPRRDCQLQVESSRSHVSSGWPNPSTAGSKWRYAKGNHSEGRVPPSWYCFVLEKRSLDGRCILDFCRCAFFWTGHWRRSIQVRSLKAYAWLFNNRWMTLVGLGLCDMGNVPRHVVFFNVKLFNRKPWTWEIQKKRKNGPRNPKTCCKTWFCGFVSEYRTFASLPLEDAICSSISGT